MGFGSTTNFQYWMGRPDPSSKGWLACSKLVIDQSGLDQLLEMDGLNGYTIFQQFPTHNMPVYMWNSLYGRWDSVN